MTDQPDVPQGRGPDLPCSASGQPEGTGPADQAAQGFPVIDPEALTPKSLLGIIDCTLLQPEETLERYSRFIKNVGRWGFRAIFLPPCYVPLAVGMLGATDVTIGAPVSFPFGYGAPEAKAAEARYSLEEGARELDVVINYSAARSGEWDLVREDLEEVLKTVKAWERMTLEGPIVVKAILETPSLSGEQTARACRIAVDLGVDYVKTATGFGSGGATVEDVRLLKEIAGTEAGVKASGGIRTWADVKEMLHAGASLIGTSAGPEIIEDFINARRT